VELWADTISHRKQLWPWLRQAI